MAQELIRHNVLSLDFWQDTVTYVDGADQCDCAVCPCDPSRKYAGAAVARLGISVDGNSGSLPEAGLLKSTVMLFEPETLGK